jgi:site-specific DNA-cytosine methylase
MKLLDLFSGRKTISKNIGDKFDEIVTVDNNPRYEPTVCMNILDWDYTIYPPGTFDVIWACPPSTEYSMLKNNNVLMGAKPELADELVLKAFEIIDYFKPRRWFLENPQAGLLKSRPFIGNLPYYDFDYCRFTNWGYKKRTRIWTNVKFNDVLCQGQEICPNMEGKYHKVSFGGQGRSKNHKYKSISTSKVYEVPASLLVALVFAPLN